MARSPFFLFGIIVVMAVCFVMVAGMMNAKQPVDAGGSAIYNNSSQPANYTTTLMTTVSNRGAVWVMPAMFLGMAFLIISVLFMVGRRR